ncbi:hypothetical protein TorRG33x02_252300 [Trema orientale]|uniref:Uncharacterized protein n=1 Tax=Trema orientale TaxID=63057 RepID=A0A2P5DGJ0_TREOI|nr:hypothetical protein TorRG33x02_252300 [Trema orientale]
MITLIGCVRRRISTKAEQDITAKCQNFPALAAEMAAALASSAIVFEGRKYSRRLVHGADILSLVSGMSSDPDQGVYQGQEARWGLFASNSTENVLRIEDIVCSYLPDFPIRDKYTFLG